MPMQKPKPKPEKQKRKSSKFLDKQKELDASHSTKSKVISQK